MVRIARFFFVLRCVITLCYYGLTMNSVNLAGDKYLNSLMGVLMELPGTTRSRPTLSFEYSSNSQVYQGAPQLPHWSAHGAYKYKKEYLNYLL